MLTFEAINAIYEELLNNDKCNDLNFVVDPVFVATSGFQLTFDNPKNELIKQLCEKIFPHALLITPNLEESIDILEYFKEVAGNNNTFGIEDIGSVDDLISIAIELHKKVKTPNVLVKGGHCPWTTSNSKNITDVLYLSKENKIILFWCY
ncbi:uncharacterized protein SCODWIG_04014 [Saccharomycodes ludwigii]|uniref:Pyridoxamine kinase/Phosphomethylpyrimidine kinase domain-containing protein n=1 Tax=Saccharomycodes ludwigii TaxID=36035 RepID=A0A376BCC8_9ASCO|nr:uncharacterized protein SCODWIG_04014 [Saccharomycodes ludwigii]